MRTDVHKIGDTAILMFAFDTTLDKAQVDEMARHVEAAMDSDEDLRLLLDMRATQEFSAGAFVSPKGMLTSLKSIGPVSRYAVVAAPAIAAAAVETFGTILPLQSRAFDAHEIEEAKAWVAAPTAG